MSQTYGNRFEEAQVGEELVEVGTSAVCSVALLLGCAVGVEDEWQPRTELRRRYSVWVRLMDRTTYYGVSPEAAPGQQLVFLRLLCGFLVGVALARISAVVAVPVPALV